MLRDMIDEQLLISKAKELGLNADADVIRKLDEIRKQNKLESLDDLAKAAQAQGVNYEDFKAQIRNQILKQKVVSEEVGRKLQLSETEENKYYAAHLKDFEQPEQIHLSEILIPLPENASSEQVAQAEAKANDVKTKVMQGGDFADLAKKFSGGPTAAQGGELGAYKKGALPQVLEDQTYPLKVGESTQPIRTRQGFVILKVTGHDPAGPAPLKDVEPQIQEALYMQAMQPALRVYLTKLREESYVNLAPGYVDSGASPNETSAVFTAYAPPPVKKKKVKAKSRFDNRQNPRYQTVAATKTAPAPSPDNGGRTITGADAVPAATPATAKIDPATGMAVIAPPPSNNANVKLGKNGKPKKVRREKIRFGQAPSKSLGGSAADDTETASVGPAAPAPGAAMASSGGGIGTTNAVPASDNLADNPLNATEAPKAKTRFAQSEPAFKAKKVAAVTAKDREKAIAVAAPASAAEKADVKEQAAPLGLAGDTATKKKKEKRPKHKKGEPRPEKQRLAEKAPAEKPVAPVIAPTANPKLAPTDVPDSAKPTTQPTSVPNSATPKPVQPQSDTTLPPASAPVPGSQQTGQPVPGTNPPN
jgi:peptidyl-prolyl cis-trans isomerase SurA